MKSLTQERQQLIEAIDDLPDEVLIELASFVNYLRYKSIQIDQPKQEGSNFLRSITGLGNSNEHDISEREEEILKQEVDPIYGWSLPTSDQL